AGRSARPTWRARARACEPTADKRRPACRILSCAALLSSAATRLPTIQNLPRLSRRISVRLLQPWRLPRSLFVLGLENVSIQPLNTDSFVHVARDDVSDVWRLRANPQHGHIGARR